MEIRRGGLGLGPLQGPGRVRRLWGETGQGGMANPPFFSCQPLGLSDHTGQGPLSYLSLCLATSWLSSVGLAPH